MLILSSSKKLYSLNCPKCCPFYTTLIMKMWFEQHTTWKRVRDADSQTPELKTVFLVGPPCDSNLHYSLRINASQHIIVSLCKFPKQCHTVLLCPGTKNNSLKVIHVPSLIRVFRFLIYVNQNPLT